MCKSEPMPTPRPRPGGLQVDGGGDRLAQVGGPQRVARHDGSRVPLEQPPSEVEGGNLAAEAHDETDIVLHDQYAYAPGADHAFEDLAESERLGAVQAGGGLVEQQHAEGPAETAGQLDQAAGGCRQL